ncbi:rab-GTPase-TBC domain-domain-containing protein [Phakopsora pachyrhizi]|uniref:Rab-GTPase-TBC domain-domain-containing protein n=1 Tax=Phakopsora pachyrhizi TaxID=170000 RepID=A0AAV0ANI7_PHAPC|nr:rab-GTPase-TBC domain-domain-containing protein [Phakopsora pachyrhizi]
MAIIFTNDLIQPTSPHSSTSSSFSSPSTALAPSTGNRQTKKSDHSISSNHHLTSRSSSTPNPSDTNHQPINQHPSIDHHSAQHIRNVYAHLDRVGVPGDGFSEGVERTREHRRLSNQLNSNDLSVNSSNHNGGHSDENLNDSELSILRAADRYGFFRSAPTERVISLDPSTFYPSLAEPTEPESNMRSVSSSLTVTDDRLLRKHESLMRKKESSRIEKWTRMLIGDRRDLGSNILSYRLRPEWDGSESQRDRFESRCFKGIPDRWRRAGWEMLMIEYEERGDSRAKGGEERDEDCIKNRLIVDRLRCQFLKFLEEPSEQDVQIDLDVPRTINGHIFFHTRYGRGQRALFQVLHTFAMYCSSCGYCQGMGPIAATLLSYFDAEMAFVCMARIHDAYGYHSIFSPGFPGLLECFYIQERLIEFLMPAVHQTFKEQMISTSAYATKWYITMFANTISYESQLRLWDVFFLKGIDSLILGSVSIIYNLRFRLGRRRMIDFEQILSCLGGRLEIEDSDRMIKSIKKLFKRIEILELIERSRSDWKGFVLDGSSASRVT